MPSYIRLGLEIAKSFSVKSDHPYLYPNSRAEARRWGRWIFVPSDGKYNRYFAVDTVATLLEVFIGQVREAYQTLELFGPEHCAGDRHELKDYKGEGDFGCSPNRQRADGVRHLSRRRGETRWNRANFIGSAGWAVLLNRAQEKLEEMRSLRQERDDSPAMGGMTLG